VDHLYLRVCTGARIGEIIPLIGKTFVIGRDVDCHLKLESEVVSRHHCTILRDDYGTRIRDLGSKNGTTINNLSVDLHGVVLVPGDLITVGEVQLRFECGPLPSERRGQDASAHPTESISRTDTLNVSPPAEVPDVAPDEAEKK
jgi:pSer/pThr/pTyr-binding forkhead associated (FHA) protein